MRGFKDYRKLTMVGVRFGLGHCSFGGQVALFCDQERPGRSIQDVVLVFFGRQQRSDGETSSPES